ncbi:MAG: phytoene desaturase [Chloroflexi bacterium]|nr:phytoene desaturase [Chloroflexota bacterium]
MATVVVVGAGVGGLAAAARLAVRGHRVTVLEANDVVGGKLGALERSTPVGNFRFDTGPSLLAMPHVFADLFAATGDPMDSVLSLRPLDPIARYRFADGSSVLTTQELAEQAAHFDEAFGAGSGRAWSAVIAQGAAMWATIEPRVMERPASLRHVVAPLPRLAEIRAIAPGRTLRQLGAQHLHDHRQRLMLERYATYLGSDPRRAPAALAVVPYLEHAHGAWYVSGGLHRLARALADRVIERGGEIHFGARVRRVTAPGSRVDGVELANGKRHTADVVVANVDATSLYGELLDPRPRRTPAADSLSGFVLLLGVRGRTPGLAHHNVLFGRSSYDAEFDAIFGRPGRPVTDPVIYVSAPDDAAVRPDGYEAWFVLVNAPRHSRARARGALDWDSAGLASGYEDRIMSLLAARGMPVRERLLFSEVITPADLERRTGAPGGAIYGGALHGLRRTFTRPRNQSRVRGLYLVGGSTHPGGGLPMVARSAAITAQLIGSP